MAYSPALVDKVCVGTLPFIKASYNFVLIMVFAAYDQVFIALM
jgi:hypothetical protein